MYKIVNNYNYTKFKRFISNQNSYNVKNNDINLALR